MSDDKSKYANATKIGLYLHHSNASMQFIAKHDPELYATIRNLRIKNRKRKQKK